MDEEEKKLEKKEVSFDQAKFYQIKKTVADFDSLVLGYLNINPLDKEKYEEAVLENFDILNQALTTGDKFFETIDTLSTIAEIYPNSKTSKTAVDTISKNFEVIRNLIRPISADDPNSKNLSYKNLCCFKAINSLRKNGESLEQRTKASRTMITNMDTFLQGLQLVDGEDYIPLLPTFAAMDFTDSKILQATLDMLSNEKLEATRLALKLGLLARKGGRLYAKIFVQKVIKGYLHKIGLDDNSIISIWAAWNEEITNTFLSIDRLVNSIEMELPIILRLEKKNTGIIKFLTTTYYLRAFQKYYWNYSGLMERKYEEYKKHLETNQETFFDPWQEERKKLTKFGLNPSTFLAALTISYPEWFWAVVENIKMIEELEKSRPGIARFLNHEFGIENFSRYPTALLIRQLDEFENTDLPYGIILYPKYDDNGAFYTNHYAFSHLDRELVGQFAVRIFEVKSVYDIAKVFKKLHRLYGTQNGTNPNPKKISFAIIGGHGNKDHVRFGLDLQKDYLMLEDLIKRQRRFKMARGLFENDAQFILISCRTGVKGGIAQIGRDVMRIDIASPEKVTNIFNFNATIFPEKQLGKKHIHFAPKYQTGQTVVYSAKEAGNEKAV